MTRPTLRIVMAALVLCGLAACSSNNKKDTMTDPMLTTLQKQVQSFGSKFELAFNADPNSDPYDAADGDIAAPSLTDDPLDVT